MTENNSIETSGNDALQLQFKNVSFKIKKTYKVKEQVNEQMKQFKIGL